MEKKNEIKKITAGFILSWIFGVIFLIMGMAIIGTGSPIPGIIIIFCSTMILPPFNKLISEKFHYEISGGIKFLLVIIIFIAMGFAMANDISKTTNKVLDENKATTLNPQQATTTNKPETKIYALGDSIEAGDFTWKITKVSTSKEIGEYLYGGTFLGEKASGIFIILDVEVENTGNKADYMMDSYVRLVDEQGREFSPNTMAAIYLKPQGSALAFEQINPGIVKKGKIVYDVPEGLKVVNLKITSNLFQSNVYDVRINI